MRPIKLKIKGLNSFIDEQEIDFNKLTEKGFFGIFGPTGSGKSTILDGITLALYGDLPRKSTNYINVNCSSLNVSFEFSISDGKTKIYRVEREFKTDKKTNRPKSGKCKVLDITKENPIILAESVKEVTKTCENIIGLSLNDFTKTVVLPQGSFSEFLKISGKDKREMLERLFNLQEYGEKLEKKLFSKSKVIEKKLDVIKGQLTGYEDVNLDDLKIKEFEFENNEKSINEKSLELVEINKNYEEGKEIINLQYELKEFLEKKEKEQIKAEEIKDKKIKVDNIERALRVLEFIENHKKVSSDLEKSNTELTKHNKEFEEINKEKQDILERYNKLSKDKYEKVPELKIEEQKLTVEIKNKIALKSLNKEINNLESEINFFRKEDNEKNSELDRLNKNIDEITLDIKNLEEKYNDLKVDSNFRTSLEEAIRLEESYKNLDEEINKYNIHIANLKDKIQEYIDKKEELQINIDENSKILRNSEMLLEGLEKNFPNSDEVLLDKKSLLKELKEKLKKFNSYEEKIILIKKEILEIGKDLSKERSRKDSIEEKITLLEKKKEKLETESLAMILRKQLVDGSACPVCGSIHHKKENIEKVNLKSLDEIKNDISLNNKDLMEKEKKIIKLEEVLKVKNDTIKLFEEDIKALGYGFKENDILNLEKEIEILDENIKQYKDKKIEIEDKISSFKENGNELNNNIKILDVNINNTGEKLKEKQEKQDENLKENTALKLALHEKKSSLKIEKFKDEYDKLLKKEKEREEVEKDIKEKRDDKEKQEKQREVKNKEKEEIVGKLISSEASLKEKNNQKKELEANLKYEFETLDDLEKRLENINEEIKNIKNNFKICEDNKVLVEEAFESIKEKLKREELNYNELENKEKIAKNELESGLKKEGFSAVSKVKEILEDRDNLNNFKSEVEKYEEDIKNLNINIKNIERKLNDRKISEEEFETLENIKKDKENELTSLKNKNLILNKDIVSMREKIKKFEEIIKEKTKVEHEEAILNDLKKLFSGRKFVDFVATERLKYIALEASKKLMEISNGNYSLNVDKDGKFMIRDLKNGGSIRDVSTLSGGETFLTSLALALALSTGLQLKKTAPLELFFLDEGFGTLDDDLLEVVISSLERIHHDKLKIGIISHVEAIKNRVPVKLIVTPAEAGMGGSKVKIEKN